MNLTRLRELESEPAVTVGERTLNYAQLRAAAGAVARELEGVRRAAVWSENTLEAIIGTVALIEAGIELVPLNPKLGSSELEHILSDSQPEAIVGAPQVAPLGHLRRLSVEVDASGKLPTGPAGSGAGRTRGLHVRHDRKAEGGPAPPARGRRQPRRARRGMVVDRG